MNIFVGKLSYDTEEASLKEAFEEFGEVSSVKIIMDKYSGRSKGFGFVEMADDEKALTAIEKLNDTELDGRSIVVNKAKPREENSRSSYGGGGGNRSSYGGGGNRSNGGGNRY